MSSLPLPLTAWRKLYTFLYINSPVTHQSKTSAVYFYSITFYNASSRDIFSNIYRVPHWLAVYLKLFKSSCELSSCVESSVSLSAFMLSSSILIFLRYPQLFSLIVPVVQEELISPFPHLVLGVGIWLRFGHLESTIPVHTLIISEAGRQTRTFNGIKCVCVCVCQPGGGGVGWGWGLIGVDLKLLR